MGVIFPLERGLVRRLSRNIASFSTKMIRFMKREGSKIGKEKKVVLNTGNI